MSSPGASKGADEQTAEASRLEELDVDFQDQDDIERDITRKVSFISTVTLLPLIFT